MSKAEGFVVLDAESEASIGGKICLFVEFLYSCFSKIRLCLILMLSSAFYSII